MRFDEVTTGSSRGLLASALGFGVDECMAVRRHATRMESRKDWSSALDAYRVSVLLEPEEPSAWRGLARVLSEMGEAQAATGATHIADMLEARRRGEPWRPRKGAATVGLPKGGARWKA